VLLCAGGRRGATELEAESIDSTENCWSVVAPFSAWAMVSVTKKHEVKCFSSYLRYSGMRKFGNPLQNYYFAENKSDHTKCMLFYI